MRNQHLFSIYQRAIRRIWLAKMLRKCSFSFSKMCWNPRKVRHFFNNWMKGTVFLRTFQKIYKISGQQKRLLNFSGKLSIEKKLKNTIIAIFTHNPRILKKTNDFFSKTLQEIFSGIKDPKNCFFFSSKTETKNEIKFSKTENLLN